MAAQPECDMGRTVFRHHGFLLFHADLVLLYSGIGGGCECCGRWSGIIISAAAISMGLMGPVWGALSDKHGRKMMVMRAMFGGSIIIGMMGFARRYSS